MHVYYIIGKLKSKYVYVYWYLHSLFQLDSFTFI